MNAKQALEQLLELLFGPADLGRFVESTGAGVPAAGAAAALEALELKAAVNATLFDRLCVDFPQRAGEIEQVARLWLPERAAAAARPSMPVGGAPPESGVWDIFLAHAAPDAPAAQVLYDLLFERGLEVFLDSRCVRLGQRWDDVIPAALLATRLVVVLISQRTRDAWYTRDEIALAIDAARGRGGPDRVRPLLVSVYLDRLPEGPSDWLFGLRGLQSMVATDVGWPSGVAERLIARLDDLDGQGAGTADPSEVPGVAPAQGHNPPSSPGPRGALEGVRAPPPTTPLQYLHLAMDLDRSEQWLALLQECRTDRSGIFLLHGERRQNLEFFVARLWHYLDDESDRQHRIVQVSARREAELPRTGAAWEVNLRYAFPNGQGTAADLLADAARHGPLFLLIGGHPLSREELDEDEVVIAALEAFLEDRLPALLAGCPGPHPVRALIATDYERLGESLQERLYARMLRGAERHGVRVRRLPEVRHVTWDHIQGYLDGLDPPPGPKVYQALKQVYDRLDHDRISYRDLAERLSRRL